MSESTSEAAGAASTGSGVGFEQDSTTEPAKRVRAGQDESAVQGGGATTGQSRGSDAEDPDADPENMNPRDLRHPHEYDGDPDGDPENMNPRDLRGHEYEGDPDSDSRS